MQGELLLTSEVDKGSEFKVRLPLPISVQQEKSVQVEDEIDYPIHELSMFIISYIFRVW